MKHVYFVLSFVALASAQLEIRDFTHNQNEDRSVNLNKLLDRFNPQIAKFITKRGLDPLYLPHSQRRLWVSDTTFDTSIEPMIYRADLILNSGKLMRLSTLKRYGNAILVYKDNIVNIEMAFEFKLLEATYNYILKLVFFNLAGRVKATANNVRAKISISFNTKNYILTLDIFKLQIFGNIRVIVDGNNGLVSKIKTAIVNMIIPYFKNSIINTAQREAAKAIRLHFSEINRLIASRQKSKSVFNYELLNRLPEQINKY